MVISKIPPKLKREHKKSDYLKAFISPLKWCPSFGYVPSIEDIRDNLKIDDATEETIQQCLGIIESARFNLGAYDTNMVKYARLPDPKELIFIYHEYPCAAVRKLFKHLDYLALRVAADYMPSFADRIFTQLNKTIKEIPPQSIGRKTNRWDDGLCYIVRDIKINSFLPEFLLREVKKITGDDIEISYAQLLSLYAILEAWLILTSLIFETYQKEKRENYRLKNIRGEFDFEMKRALAKSMKTLISELESWIYKSADFWTSSTGGDTKKVNVLIDAMSDDLYQHFDQYATEKTFKLKTLPVGLGATPFQQELKNRQTKNISSEFDYKLEIELAKRATIFLPRLRDWIKVKSKRWIKTAGGNIENADTLINSMNGDIELIIKRYTERNKDFKFDRISEATTIDIIDELSYIKENLIYAEQLLELSDRQFLLNEKQNIESELLGRKEKRRSVMEENRKDREKLEGVQIMLEKWIEYYETINKKPAANKFFRHLLKYFCIDDDSIKALLHDEDVPASEDIKPVTEQTDKKVFYQTTSCGKVFYVGILPDKTTPMNHKTATLYQITEDEMGKLSKSDVIVFTTFQKYYTEQNPNPRKVKQKSQTQDTTKP